MRLATKNDRNLVVRVLQKAFNDNPTMQFMTRSSNKEKYIARVIKYAFDFAIRRNGVFITKNGKGVAIYFSYNEKKKDLLDLYYQLRLVVTALPILKLAEVWAHTQKVNKLRAKKPKFLYVWFIGVDPTEYPRTSPAEFKKAIFESARNLRMDIYAETTRRDLKIGYERLGFQVYKKWHNSKSNLKVWFLKKPFESSLV
jgi:hypothetical protein